MQAYRNGRFEEVLIRDEIDFVMDADREMREHSKCPKCGKPKEGIVKAGETLRMAGLCTCNIVADGQQELFK